MIKKKVVGLKKNKIKIDSITWGSTKTKIKSKGGWLSIALQPHSYYEMGFNKHLTKLLLFKHLSPMFFHVNLWFSLVFIYLFIKNKNKRNFIALTLQIYIISLTKHQLYSITKDGVEKRVSKNKNNFSLFYLPNCLK